jgi:UDP-N-acetylglucosamine--N-acetylmuramyl-(pentapeptide) pyrophosphoryl-undecaprenol N-acetylglucosamine transferase
VAIAEEVRAREPAADVRFVGTARGIEARVLPGLGWPLDLIDATGLKTVGALGALVGLLRIPRALWQSFRILRRQRPDVVIGVGGYASGPVVLCAWLLGIPTAILEQNSIPGLANKILGHFALRVFLAFEETRRFFARPKIVLSGNPIRRELLHKLLAAQDDSPRSCPHVFCFGGSLGAKAVNTLMADAMHELQGSGFPLTLVHQTGKDDHAAITQRYQSAGISADVREFISDMAAEYGRADLVVSRAGATTVAELTALGRPAILVPYPFAADNHQETNARALVQEGGALVFRQAELDGKKLAQALRTLLEDPDRLKRMQSAMRSLGRPQAAGTIADWLLEQAARSKDVS